MPRWRRRAEADEAAASAARAEAATTAAEEPPAGEGVALREDFSETAFFAAAPAARAGRLGHDRVQGAGLGHRVERLGARDHHRPARAARSSARPARSRSSWCGPTCRASCARATGPRSEVVVNNAGDAPLDGSARLRDHRPRHRRGPARPVRPRRRLRDRRRLLGRARRGHDPRVPGDGPVAGRHRGLHGHRPRRRPSRTASCGRCRCCRAGCTSRSRASSPCATPTAASSTSPTCGSRRPDPDQRPARGHGRRPALLLGAQRAALPGQLPLRVHRADPQPLPVDRHPVVAVRPLPGGGADGEGVLDARHPARDLGGHRPQPQDGARGDAVAADRPRRHRAAGRRSSTCSTRGSPRPSGTRPSPSSSKAQTSLGAFPWFPGGPPSPYMTLYILYGFSKALEFGVEVPRTVVERAWAYMHQHYVDELVGLMMRHDCCWETITFLNYVLSSYPDESWTGGVFTADDRQQHARLLLPPLEAAPPLLKGYLALTLERAGRHDDAQLVFDRVMDSAKTDQDLGTYWAPEDRAWLWYNDTIETHAFALRTLGELEPEDGRRARPGAVAVAQQEAQPLEVDPRHRRGHLLAGPLPRARGRSSAQREDAHRHRRPDPADASSSSRTSTPAPATRSSCPARRSIPRRCRPWSSRSRRKGFAFASATWHFSTEQLPEEARGDLFAVTRTLLQARRTSATSGCSSRSPRAPRSRPATRSRSSSRSAPSTRPSTSTSATRAAPASSPRTLASGWQVGPRHLGWYEEIRDRGTNFFFEWLPAGEYTFKLPPARQHGAAPSGSARRPCSPCTRPSSPPTQRGHRLVIGGGGQ